MILLNVMKSQFVLFYCFLVWADLENRVLFDHLLEFLSHLKDTFDVSSGLPIGITIIITFAIFNFFLDVFQVFIQVQGAFDNEFLAHLDDVAHLVSRILRNFKHVIEIDHINSDLVNCDSRIIICINFLVRKIGDWVLHHQ